MQQNRIEKVWYAIKPDILKKWGRLDAADLDACDGQSDLIIEAIRKIYYPGRSHITLEAEIRDWLLGRMEHYERTEQK